MPMPDKLPMELDALDHLTSSERKQYDQGRDGKYHLRRLTYDQWSSGAYVAEMATGQVGRLAPDQAPDEPSRYAADRASADAAFQAEVKRIEAAQAKTRADYVESRLQTERERLTFDPQAERERKIQEILTFNKAADAARAERAGRAAGY
jgi:hypothetical protein